MNRLLLPLLLLALVAPAQAQSVAATSFDITNAGAFDPDVDCAAVVDGSFVWFDDGTDSIYLYGEDGTASEFVSAADLDTAAGVDVDRCRAATAAPGDDGAFYFVLAGSDNVDLILSVSPGETTTLERLTTAADQVGDGAIGLVVANGKLYVAVSEFFSDNTQEDGIYSLALTGADQTSTAVATEDQLSLSALTADADGNLYAVSNNFGAGDFQDVIVKVEDPEGTAALSVLADPFDGVFNDSRTDLESIVYVSTMDGEALYVLNNNFSGTDGEEVARFNLDGTGGEVVISQTTILSDLGRTEPGFTANGPTTLLFDDFDDVLYLVNSSAFGGADEILVVANPIEVNAEPGTPASGVEIAVGPNPFRDAVRVEVSVDAPQAVAVTVLDALGREVAVLHRGAVAGAVEATLPAGDLPAGLYLVRIETAGGVAVRPVTLAR